MLQVAKLGLEPALNSRGRSQTLTACRAVVVAGVGITATGVLYLNLLFFWLIEPSSKHFSFSPPALAPIHFQTALSRLARGLGD